MDLLTAPPPAHPSWGAELRGVSGLVEKDVAGLGGLLDLGRQPVEFLHHRGVDFLWEGQN